MSLQIDERLKQSQKTSRSYQDSAGGWFHFRNAHDEDELIAYVISALHLEFHLVPVIAGL